MAKPAVLQRFFNWAIWNRAFNLEDPNQKIDGTAIAEIFGGSPSYTGITINEDNALKFSAIWAANRAIADPISYMGAKVYRKLPDGGREEAKDHPVNQLFKKPNPYSTWVTSCNRYITHRNLWGNGLYKKEYQGGRRGGDLKAIHPIHPSAIKEIVLEDSGKLTYQIYKKDKSGYDSINGDEILHLMGLGDNLVGKSVIQYAKEDIGLEFAVQQYGAQVFKEGGDPRGMYSVKAQLNTEQMKDLEKRIKEQLERSKKLIVGADATYQPFAMKPADAEFIMSRHFNVNTIARWFGVPAWKLAEHSDGSSTFNNIEHMGIAFLQDTLAPIVANMENEFNVKLFREKEQEEGYYVEFNMDSYLRADAKSRAEMHRTDIQNAIKTPNEIRAMNNDNPKPGGDELYIQQNMMPLSMAGEVMKNKTSKNGN